MTLRTRMNDEGERIKFLLPDFKSLSVISPIKPVLLWRQTRRPYQSQRHLFPVSILPLPLGEGRVREKTPNIAPNLHPLVTPN
jgi:hypothetical protein